MKHDPQLSANQLSEYINASPVRQRSILKAAKYSDSPAPLRYQHARRAIARFLSADRPDLQILQQAKDNMQSELDEHERRHKILKDFFISDYTLSIDAIDKFIGSLNKFSLAGKQVTLGEHRPPKIDIEGVAISVRPDVVVQSKNRKGEPIVGGCLLFFGKDVDDDDSERKEFCLCASSLVHMYAEEKLNSLGAVERTVCLSFDIFGQSVHAAPNSYVKRKNNMIAACQNIAAIWPTI